MGKGETGGERPGAACAGKGVSHLSGVRTGNLFSQSLDPDDRIRSRVATARRGRVAWGNGREGREWPGRHSHGQDPRLLSIILMLPERYRCTGLPLSSSSSSRSHSDGASWAAKRSFRKRSRISRQARRLGVENACGTNGKGTERYWFTVAAGTVEDK